MVHRHHRGTILLIIVQSWLVPCYGFAYTPPHCPSSSHASLVAAPGTAYAPLLCAPRRWAQPSLSMSDGGGDLYEPYGDEPRPPDGNQRADNSDGAEPDAPPAYREEHTSGGSMFRELLNRAQKPDPSTGRASPPSPPPAQPGRRLPPRPTNAPNYDDDSQWEEEPRRIGSPDLPDPPLRKEMPGLRFATELDDGGPPGGPPGGGGRDEGRASGGGGSRFQRMMDQAQYNDQRQEAGVGPKISPRSPEAGNGKPRAALLTRDEKQRAMREAVDRQQKLMSAARGFDLDDPTLDGPELAKKKALSRAQAEATTGGYVPSTSASDDYLDALKSDSKQKTKTLHAKLSGRPVPPESQQPAPTAPGVADAGPYEPQDAQDDEEQPEYVPQRRTHSTSSIQNESDAYIAGLSGIKVDLDTNPYLQQKRYDDAVASAKVAGKILKLTPSSKQASSQPSGSPTMSYADKLRQAREAKASESTDTLRSAVTAAAASPPAISSVPEVPQAPPAAPTLRYAEKLKQAREVKGALGAAAISSSSSSPPPRVAFTPVVTPAVPAASSSLDQQVPENAVLGSQDATRAKVARVMDMLTEHETAGQVGRVQATELRSALIETQETLRAEIYGSSEAPVGPAAPTNPMMDDEDATQAKLARVMDMLTEHETAGQVGGVQAAELRSALIDTQETLRAEIYGSSEAPVAPAAPTNPMMDDEDATQAKMMRVMNLLTEHKTKGLVGEERVAELRDALVDTRETLRAETYGQHAPATTTTSPPVAGAARPVGAGAPTSGAEQQRLVQPQAQPAPTSPEAEDTLRRCSALLRAHVHATLMGQDLQSLREGLASSLAIVDAQIASTGAQPVQQAPPPSRVEEVGDVVPESVNGIQSVGEVFSDMGVGKKPENFEPENDSGGEKGWAGGSLGEYEKSVGTKGLGYLLKHRGGKGYGRGRLNGKEAEMMVSTLAELTDILQEEMVEN